MIKNQILPILFLFLFAMFSNGLYAQGYVSSEEATELLLQEVKAETVIFDDASSSTELKERAAFRIKYYNAILYKIGEGNSVAASIEEAEPKNMPKFHDSGMVYFHDSGNFKLEKNMALERVNEILSE